MRAARSGAVHRAGRDLFEVMATGGRVGFETVAWFNGGLFDDSTTLPLEKSDIETVLAASDLDWSEIDPSILGTLFERGLDPGKRAQLGAHYTDRDKIDQQRGFRLEAGDPARSSVLRTRVTVLVRRVVAPVRAGRPPVAC